MHSIKRLAEFGEDWWFMSRTEGWVRAAPLIAREVAGTAFFRAEFCCVARSLDETRRTCIPKLPLTIRPFQKEDIERVRQTRRPSEAGLCERRFDRGQVGLAGFFQDEFVGYTWACARLDADLERVTIPLGPRDVFVTDDYTVPAFRGQGVQTALVLTRDDLCHTQGYKRAVAYIEAQNEPSLRTSLKMGYKTIGRFAYTRIGGWRHVRWLQMPREQGAS